MEKLKCIEDMLIKEAKAQLENNFTNVNTKELGEVMDMIKDIEQAIYYYSISEAMQEEGNKKYYTEQEYWNPSMMMTNEEKNPKEGKSPIARWHYIEAKEHNKGKEMQMKELEKYIQDLTMDIMEMMADSSAEEKQMLSQKISLLATKIK